MMFLPDNSVYVPVTDPNQSPLRTANGRLPMDARLTTFDEVEQTYTEEEALLEASRCYGCPTHWCTKACPAGVPVTEFIAKIREQDYEGAYALISTASLLPEICSRVCPQEKQCQSNCTRSIKSQAVGIGRLERFVVEQHYANAAPKAVTPTGKSVAVIGSGPSGLAAAQALADQGHAVTVYEGNDRPGGLLRYGIPNMKLEKGVLDRKLDAMAAQGVQFKTGIRVGSDISAAEVTASHDAVVLCVGTGNARTLQLDGAENASGIVYAVDYLSASTRAVLAGEASDAAKDKAVVIIGGGDTGNDCVGTAIRQGCASVTQIEMLPRVTAVQHLQSPLYQRPAEVKFDSSQEECLTKFSRDPHLYQATVKAVTTDETGAIQAVTVVRLEATYDEARRLRMVEIPGTEQVLPCQLLVIAAGFLGPCADVAEAFGVATDSRSNLAANDYATNVPKVFACGDCRTGQSLVVKAMVEGRQCAKAVDAFLK
jgi:glutamate synthase (NADPH/NADH) small chain